MHGTHIEIRQCKYLNNIIESDHRRIKRNTKSIGSFKNFISTGITLAGIEMMNMLRKRQVYTGGLLDFNFIDDLQNYSRFFIIISNPREWHLIAKIQNASREIPSKYSFYYNFYLELNISLTFL